MTGYHEYFARRDAAEAARVKEAVAAIAGASNPEPAKKGLAGVWKVYWGVWASIAAGCLVLLQVAAADTDGAMTAGVALGVWAASLPFLAVGALLVAVPWGMLFEEPNLYHGEPVARWGPTQNQLLLEQNELLRRIAAKRG